MHQRCVPLFGSRILWVIGGFGLFDLRLTPDRVEKLFSDTDYENVSKLIDTVSYDERSEGLRVIVEDLNQQEGQHEHRKDGQHE